MKVLEESLNFCCRLNPDTNMTYVNGTAEINSVFHMLLSQHVMFNCLSQSSTNFLVGWIEIR